MNETFTIPKLGVIHNDKYYIKLVISCYNYDFRCKSREQTIYRFDGIDNYIKTLESAFEIYCCLEKHAFLINTFHCDFKESIDINLSLDPRRGVTPYFYDRAIQTYPKFWGETIKTKDEIDKIKQEWEKIKNKLFEINGDPLSD